MCERDTERERERQRYIQIMYPETVYYSSYINIAGWIHYRETERDRKRDRESERDREKERKEIY